MFYTLCPLPTHAYHSILWVLNYHLYKWAFHKNTGGLRTKWADEAYMSSLAKKG